MRVSMPGFWKIALSAATVSVGIVPKCARAQCSFDWRPGESLPGIDGSVVTMARWDPDGLGPIWCSSLPFFPFQFSPLITFARRGTALLGNRWATEYQGRLTLLLSTTTNSSPVVILPQRVA